MLRRSILILPLVAVAALAACQGCRSSRTPPPPPPPAADVGPPTLRLYFVTDLAGALEPCGCTKDQLGGLGHFGAWVKQSEARAPQALVASAGPLFFMDPRVEGERADQDRAKAETIAKVLKDLGFAAFAPGVNDRAAGPETFQKLADASGAAVANGPETAVVRDVAGIKIAFVGVGPPEAGVAPADVVKAGVDDAKKHGANLIVALVSVGRGEAKRIADFVPDLAAIVVGSEKSSGEGNTTAPPGERVGDAVIVQAGNHLQSVAVLDVFVRDAVAPGAQIKLADATGLELGRKREDLQRRIDELHVKIAAWERDNVSRSDLDARKQDLAKLEAERDALDVKPPPAQGSFFRYTVKEMRESLGTDARIESLLAGYYKSVDEHNRIAFADRLPPAPAPDQATYVGSEACTSCHPAARKVWDGTPHAHAYATLSTQFKEFNLDCVSCHVTGYERAGGSTVTHVDKLKDVQCEVCHGPGSKHPRDPTDKRRIVARPDPSVCLDCHHPPHVEGFDPQAKMAAVLGPGHGMPLR